MKNEAPLLDFSGKTVLITGGSRGIGRATAIAFSSHGARVAINFKSNQQAATETIEQLQGSGHLAVKADISHSNLAQRMLEAVVQEFGQLDILVNNAGIYQSHRIDKINYDTWQKTWQTTLTTNLIAAANLCYCAAQHMIENKFGKIINVSSRGAFRGEPDHPAYAASKAGLNAMSQSLALALAKYNISVTAVAPGFVETDMAAETLRGPAGEEIMRQSPFGRVARPDEVAYAILFYASDQAQFMSGGILDVNGASYLRT